MFKKVKISVWIIALFAISMPTIYLCTYGTFVSFFDSHSSVLKSIEISLMDTNKYDTLFSPLEVFLTAAGTILTVIVLLNQIQATKLQKEESIINSFNNQLNMMITMRSDIINTVILDENIDNHIFVTNDYRVGKAVFSMIVDSIFIDKRNINNRVGIKLISCSKFDLLDILRNNAINNKDDDSIKSFSFLADEVISSITHGSLSPFFHNVYTTLKIIHENKYLLQEDKNNYFRMVRSHFTQPEFILIYYHALVFVDENKRKFKQLIEDTCFFHSIILDKIPIKIKIHDGEEDKFGYSYRAFFHSRAEYLEYLKRQRKSKNNQSQNR